MWRPLAEKFPRNPRIFFGDSVETPEIRKPAQKERKNSAPFSRKLEKIEIFPPNFLELKNFPHAKF